MYELGRIFRNEGIRSARLYTDFNGMMDLFEDLLSSAAKELLGGYQLTWQGQALDLTPGWPRLPMHEAVKKYTGLDFMAIASMKRPWPRPRPSASSCPATADPTWGNALYEVFDQKVEEKLIQPTFITMHPVDVSPLAKRAAPPTRA